MSSVDGSRAATRATQDMTARARIRDAAIELFGERGFRATTVRAIAEHAGVSAALVVHHFGSKDGLRQAVDDHLADDIRADKFAALSSGVGLDTKSARTAIAEHAAVFSYLSRALTEGTEAGAHLYDRLFHDAVDYMKAAQDAGLVQATADPAARAAALLNAGLAQTLLHHHLQRVLGEGDQVEALVRITPSLLDLYTDGLFTDSRFRDQWDPPPQEES
ncbi:MAG: TetR family transcriptional regulator [Ornithinimicrobium sp.]